VKFIYFPLPAIPATLEDRRRKRPIAYRTERWQKMFDEVVDLARMCEDLGFEAVTFPERGMDTLVEAGNPEYFAWLSDQGMLPLEEVKRQLRIFGEQILPHYRS
jgi:hypothetical protein